MSQTRNIIALEIILVRTNILLLSHLEEALVSGCSLHRPRGENHIQMLELGSNLVFQFAVGAAVICEFVAQGGVYFFHLFAVGGGEAVVGGLVIAAEACVEGFVEVACC
jgi:hypothetical protein